MYWTPHLLAEDDARAVVVRAAEQMVAAGLVIGSAGNISVRLESGELCVTPAGMDYAEMRVEDLPIVDPKTGQWRGPHRPTSETALHSGVMLRLPHVGAIVHTHSRFATAFAVARREIPYVCNESLGIRAERILLTDYAPPGSQDLGKQAVRAFERQPGSRAILLANHGVVAIAADVQAALLVARQVEWIAEITYRAHQLGGAVALPREMQLAMAENYGSYVAGEHGTGQDAHD